MRRRFVSAITALSLLLQPLAAHATAVTSYQGGAAKQALVSQQASITADSSLDITAGRDVVAAGAKIASASDASLNAEQKLGLMNLEDGMKTALSGSVDAATATYQRGAAKYQLEGVAQGTVNNVLGSVAELYKLGEDLVYAPFDTKASQALLDRAENLKALGQNPELIVKHYEGQFAKADQLERSGDLVGATALRVQAREEILSMVTGAVSVAGGAVALTAKLASEAKTMASAAAKTEILASDAAKVEQTTIFVTPKGVAVKQETLKLQGTSAVVGDFRGLEGTTVDEIISRIPSDWKLIPQDRGAGIKFIDAQGYERIRLHAASASAPAGSNSASGWTLRVMDQSGKYYDNLGNVVPSKANSGHIPIYGNPALSVQ